MGYLLQCGLRCRPLLTKYRVRRQQWGQGAGMDWSKAEWEEGGGATHLQLSHYPILQSRVICRNSCQLCGKSFGNSSENKTVSEVVIGAQALSPPFSQCSSCVLSGFGSRLLLYIRDICSFTQPVNICGPSAICGKSAC